MEGEKIAAGEVEAEVKAEANGASASRIRVLRSLRKSRVRTEILIEIESSNMAGRATVVMGKDFAKCYKKKFRPLKKSFKTF